MMPSYGGDNPANARKFGRGARQTVDFRSRDLATLVVISNDMVDYYRPAGCRLDPSPPRAEAAWFQKRRHQGTEPSEQMKQDTVPQSPQPDHRNTSSDGYIVGVAIQGGQQRPQAGCASFSRWCLAGEQGLSSCGAGVTAPRGKTRQETDHAPDIAGHEIRSGRAAGPCQALPTGQQFCFNLCSRDHSALRPCASN